MCMGISRTSEVVSWVVECSSGSARNGSSARVVEVWIGSVLYTGFYRTKGSFAGAVCVQCGGGSDEGRDGRGWL